jgi:hypothetical protein
MRATYPRQSLHLDFITLIIFGGTLQKKKELCLVFVLPTLRLKSSSVPKSIQFMLVPFVRPLIANASTGTS